MIRLSLISDTHGQHRRISIGKTDILFFAGDYSLDNSEPELLDFLDWFCSQPARARVMISGNHDRFQWKHPERFQANLKNRPLHYLENSGTELLGLRIWGSPVSVPVLTDRSRRFELNAADRMEVWNLIPENTDILITHTPPQGILDLAGGMHCGCCHLADKIPSLRLKFHFFGHIHEDSGSLKRGDTIYSNGARSGSGRIPFRNQALEFDFPGEKHP